MNLAVRDVHTARTRLDSTFERVRAIPCGNLELLSDCSRYLCVLVSGFLETSVVSLVVAYIGDVAHARATRLVERKLRYTTNLNAENLSQLVGALDADWERDLREYLADDRKAAIDSLVALRHQIAHGRPTGVTLVTVTSYYESIGEVVDYLSQVLDPKPSPQAA